MSRANPKIRNFAERLVVFEAAGPETFGTKVPTAFEGYEKLRPQLVTLMGNGGYRALLSRALALAKAEVPRLQTVRVNEDGALEGLAELHAQLKPDEFLESSVILLTQMLGLMVAFIGENLTLRLMHEVWPKVPINDLDFEIKGKNEKAK